MLLSGTTKTEIFRLWVHFKNLFLFFIFGASHLWSRFIFPSLHRSISVLLFPIFFLSLNLFFFISCCPLVFWLYVLYIILIHFLWSSHLLELCVCANVCVFVSSKWRDEKKMSGQTGDISWIHARNQQIGKKKTNEIKFLIRSKLVHLWIVHWVSDHLAACFAACMRSYKSPFSCAGFFFNAKLERKKNKERTEVKATHTVYQTLIRIFHF